QFLVPTGKIPIQSNLPPFGAVQLTFNPAPGLTISGLAVSVYPSTGKGVGGGGGGDGSEVEDGATGGHRDSDGSQPASPRAEHAKSTVAIPVLAVMARCSC